MEVVYYLKENSIQSMLSKLAWLVILTKQFQEIDLSMAVLMHMCMPVFTQKQKTSLQARGTKY
jgi:ribose/xylose/arabinose/galactoside ABC-type transport system permease subunit